MTKVISLMYHDVYEGNPNESGIASVDCATYKVSKKVFEEHLKAINHLISIGCIERKDIRLTFDDGGISFSKIIMPLLDKYGFVGHFFVATSFIGRKGFLTAEMIQNLMRHGHKVGAHSHSHRQRMHTLSYEELFDDWGKSINILNRILGGEVYEVSLPNGYQSKNIMKAIQNNGINMIYTSNPVDEVKTVGDVLVYGRYAVRREMSAEDIVRLITSNKLRLKLKRKFYLLGIVKCLMGKSYLWLREKLLN